MQGLRFRSTKTKTWGLHSTKIQNTVDINYLLTEPKSHFLYRTHPLLFCHAILTINQWQLVFEFCLLFQNNMLGLIAQEGNLYFQVSKKYKSVIVIKNQVQLYLLSSPKFVQRRTKFKGLWSRPNWYKSLTLEECYEAKVLSLGDFTRNLSWKLCKQFHNCLLVRLATKFTRGNSQEFQHQILVRIAKQCKVGQ